MHRSVSGSESGPEISDEEDDEAAFAAATAQFRAVIGMPALPSTHRASGGSDAHVEDDEDDVTAEPAFDPDCDPAGPMTFTRFTANLRSGTTDPKVLRAIGSTQTRIASAAFLAREVPSHFEGGVLEGAVPAAEFNPSE